MKMLGFICSVAFATLLSTGAMAQVRLSPTAAPTSSPAPSPKPTRSAELIEFDAPGTGRAVTNVCYPTCGTLAYAINDLGVIAGSYDDPYFVRHAFVRVPGGRIITFDEPKASRAGGTGNGTVAYAIDDRNDIAGEYTDAAKVYHGFVRSAAGLFTTFDIKDAGSKATQGTIAWDIVLDGTTAGYYTDAQGLAHGFVRSHAGKVAAIEPAGSKGTFVCAVSCLNVAGAVTGYFTDASGTSRGFVRDAAGKVTTFDVPGAAPGKYAGTFPSSIDAAGTVAGYYVDHNLHYRSFLRAAGGTFATFAGPNSALATVTFSINVLGAVTGQTQDYRGFERSASGTFDSFAAPDADKQPGFGTRPSANDREGRVTGWYLVESGLHHGFVWIPPAAAKL